MRTAEIKYQRGDNTTGVWVFRVLMQEGQEAAYCDRLDRDSAVRAEGMYLTHGTLPHDARRTKP